VEGDVSQNQMTRAKSAEIIFQSTIHFPPRKQNICGERVRAVFLTFEEELINPAFDLSFFHRLIIGCHL
jgi:hypothetical protein